MKDLKNCPVNNQTLAQIQERLWSVHWRCSELRWEHSQTTSNGIKIQHNFQVSPKLCKVLDQMIERGTLHSELFYFMIRPKSFLGFAPQNH